MTAKTSMLHVRVDEAIKAQASDTLAKFGLSVSDAVRILLTRIVNDGALPVGLTVDEKTYDEWFRDKVLKALNNNSAPTSHDDAVARFKNRLAQ